MKFYRFQFWQQSWSASSVHASSKPGRAGCKERACSRGHARLFNWRMRLPDSRFFIYSTSVFASHFFFIIKDIFFYLFFFCNKQHILVWKFRLNEICIQWIKTSPAPIFLLCGVDGFRCRPVVPGCIGYAMEHPDFGRSVNPISIRGTDYAQLITTGTPGFSDLLTALRWGLREWVGGGVASDCPPQLMHYIRPIFLF